MVISVYESILSKTVLHSDYTDGPPDELSFQLNNAGGNDVLDQDDIIKITIDMSGEVQTFELKDE